MVRNPLAPPNDSHLLQYLVIGDLIARGMLQVPFHKRKLEDTVEAHIVPGIPETAADGARCIKTWVGPNLDQWDIISFNFGLNDSTKNPRLSHCQIWVEHHFTSQAPIPVTVRWLELHVCFSHQCIEDCQASPEARVLTIIPPLL